MFLWRQITALFDLLIEESTPEKLAGGIVLGMFLGMTPFPTLQWLVYFALFFILSVNLAAALVSYFVFLGIGLCLDSIFHPIGWYVLTGIPFLQKPYAWSYHSIILPFTRFSNSVVMGSFVVSWIIAFPLYAFSKKVLKKNGPRIWYRIKQSFMGRVWLTSRVYRAYVTEKSQ